MTGPGSSNRCTVLLPVLLLLLAAGLLYTGSNAFRVRDNPVADVCTGEKCPNSDSSATPPSTSGVRLKPVSLRGSFVKPPPEPEDEARPDEEIIKSVEEERVIPKWKEKKARPWSKLTKIKDDEVKKDEDVSEAKKDEDDKVDSDDELVQIEVEDDDDDDDDEDEDDEEEAIVEDDEQSGESDENVLLEQERKKKELEEERKRKEKKEEEERSKKEKELEEKRLKEEAEKKKKEEAERRLKEEAERRKREKELEEKRKREEAERKRKEEAEKRLKEEAERLRKEKELEEKQKREEAERKRKEEAEKRLKEEAERLRKKKELEEKRLKEEAERKRREEDERRKREEAERRLKEEAERKKREKELEEKRIKEEIERKKKEEAEKRKREKELEEKRKKEEEEAERKKKLEAEQKRKLEESKKTLEKIRLADKDKEKPTEVPRANPSATKSNEQAAKPTQTKSQAGEPSKKSTTTEPTNTTGPKRSGPEAFLSLAKLNDMLLSVPTFVPNFTAVENRACQQHGKIFLRQLRGYKLWALQMLDSSAKIPSGLLRGNVNQLGDFDQCLGVLARVKLDDKVIKVQGKYCLANVDLYASHPDAKVAVNLMQSRALIRGNVRDPGHFVPRFTTANWAVCLPATCTHEDAQRSIEDALNSYNDTIGIKFIVNIDSDSCYVQATTSSYSKETIGALYFYAMFICLAIIATLRDYFGNAQEKGNYSERIIMAFSLKRTLKALFGNKETSSSDIGCIHGIRALSTAALYVAHKLIPISRIPYANRVSLTEVASHPLSLVLRASLFYTDSFLLLSGVLTAYNMARELQDRGEIRWFCRLVARYIRLTPSLLAVVYWYAFVMEHTGSGPQWNPAVKANADICKENSWTNFLYIQNFFPFEEMCAPHTHQLALDMQLSLAAPALVFFLQVRPVVGMIVVFFLLQVSATLRYFATSNNNLSLVIFHGMTSKQLYKTANMTYTLPLHRATPYLFGVGLGVLLHYVGKNFRLNKIISLIGWLIALALGTWSLFSPWRLARRDYVYDVDEATHYAVVSPILTALALSWTIFACFTDNSGFINRILSSYWMVVFSKLSYAIYLSQFAVFFYNVGTVRYSSEFHPFRALDPLEAACVISVSVVLTLLFDIPTQEVKNIIMESSDYATAENEKSKDTVEENHNNVKGIPQESSFEDEEPPPGGWNWDRGTFTRLANDVDSPDYDDSMIDEPPYRSSRLKRLDMRRQTIIRSDTMSSAYDEWDSRGNSRRTSRSEEPFDDRRSSREYRLSGSGLDDDLAEDSYLYRKDRAYSRGFSKSPIRDLDAPVVRRSLSRERHVSAEPDIPSREYSSKPLITISKEDDYQQLRSPRSSIPRFPEQQRSISTESEMDLSSSRRSSTSFTRHSSIEPRVVDEDEWEEDVRLRRNRFFQDRISSQERDHVPPPIVEEEVDDMWDSLKRRSSAEGKMALLKEPIRPGNIALWTVSKIHLGSSQEPDDEDLDEEGYHRKRPEYREQGPPLREEFEGEEEFSRDTRRKSFTSGSLPTSFEEEDDLSDFSLRSDNKRVIVQDLSRTVQDLSRLSSEEESPVESNPNQLDVKPLIKRESMIKSQASEEDPEYLLPERPKLVEQEQEHPFKKAWQMQKSRSEEDGSSPFVVKELKSASTSLEKQDEEPENKREEDEEKTSHEGAQSEETDTADVSCDVTLVWQSRSNDIDKNGGFSKSKSSSESDLEREEDEEDQIDGYRGRGKSSEDWPWSEKDT